MKKLDIWHKKLNQDKKFSMENLSLDEINKAKSFYKESDKQNYISSHIFLHEILSYYYPNISLNEWLFQINQYGKPSVATIHGINFHFNLSHSKSHIYIIYSKDLECGIDIEDIRDINLEPSLVNLVLNDIEQKEFSLSTNKKNLFFKYWTLKEAHLKTIGDGISVGLKTITFKNLEEKENYFKVQDIHYYSFNYDDEYYLSFSAKTKENIEVNYRNNKDLNDK